jgi:hypothetical protein
MVTAQIEHYRTVSFTIVTCDNDGNKIDSQDKECNILVTYDLTAWTLTLQYEKPITYYISSIVNTINHVDTNGNNVLIKELDTRDSDNNTISIWLCEWSDMHYRNFTIREDNSLFLFNCVRIY